MRFCGGRGRAGNVIQFPAVGAGENASSSVLFCFPNQWRILSKMTQQGKSLVVRAVRKGRECARAMDVFLRGAE